MTRHWFNIKFATGGPLTQHTATALLRLGDAFHRIAAAQYELIGTDDGATGTDEMAELLLFRVKKLLLDRGITGFRLLSLNIQGGPAPEVEVSSHAESA